MPFNLKGYLAGAGALEIEFSIVDLASGQSLHQVKPTIAEAGHSWTFGLNGVLSPGYYGITVSAASSASSETPLAAYGGFGEYELAFSAGNPTNGDVNFDSVVDGADLALWSSAFGQNAVGDLDGSGTSDGADFLIWQRNFNGGGASSVSPIPEPTGILLMCFATLLLSRSFRFATVCMTAS